MRSVNLEKPEDESKQFIDFGIGDYLVNDAGTVYLRVSDGIVHLLSGNKIEDKYSRLDIYRRIDPGTKITITV